MSRGLILGLLAETPIHPGTGRSTGIIDLPVAREAATDFPVLAGSSLKGALRQRAEQANGDQANRLFGQADQAGDLLVSDARLLLLPVRSLSGAYRWVTCPLILERFSRDLKRAGLRQVDLQVPSVERGQAIVTSDSGPLYLEERRFEMVALEDSLSAVIEQIGQLIAHEASRNRLAQQLAILHDDDFSWFARYGLAIQARNQLEDGTKKSKNLWYEETLPVDTLMYALVVPRALPKEGKQEGSEHEEKEKPDPLQEFKRLFSDRPYLQAGGNETVGHGWFAVKILP